MTTLVQEEILLTLKRVLHSSIKRSLEHSSQHATTDLSSMNHKIFPQILTAILVASTSHAATINYMIGDDDGFGGVQGSQSNPGDPYSTVGGTLVPPGNLFNESATDVVTEAPWTPYTFTFEFNWDTSTLQTISQATITVQSGSLARRNDNSGFGFATVTANTTNLGDFLTTNTGTAGSTIEETVKWHIFDVTPFVTPNDTGLVTLVIDGSNLTSPNPIDLFAFDYVTFSISGDPVPEPSITTFFALGLLFLRRKR